MIGLLELMGLTLMIVSLGVWAITLLRWWRAASSPSRPMLRHARAWLYAPLWSSALIGAVTLLPGALGALGLWADHCLTQGAAHHHLCLVHLPHTTHSALIWACLGVMTCVLGARLGVSVFRLMRRRAMAASLVKMSHDSLYADNVRILEQEAPLALTLGWPEATILLSSGLLAQVTPKTLEVILAHERAHIARRDLGVAMLDELMATIWPARVKTLFLEALSFERERRCDELAALEVGSRRGVALAISEVVRLEVRQSALGMSIASAAALERVDALLKPTPATTMGARVRPALLLLSLIALGVGPIHSGVELLLNILTH